MREPVQKIEIFSFPFMGTLLQPESASIMQTNCWYSLIQADIQQIQQIDETWTAHWTMTRYDKWHSTNSQRASNRMLCLVASYIKAITSNFVAWQNKWTVHFSVASLWFLCCILRKTVWIDVLSTNQSFIVILSINPGQQKISCYNYYQTLHT